MNTAIQCLKSINLLSAYFLSEQYMKDINEEKDENQFVDAFSYMLLLMWQDNKPVYPENFKEILGKFYPTFKNNRQHDAVEAYIKMIDLLHEGLCYQAAIHWVEHIPESQMTLYDKINISSVQSWRSRFENNYSIIQRLFTGQFWSRIKCEECGNLSSNFDPFSIINLPINPNTNTIFDCINYYILSDDLCDGNQITCDRCKKKCDGKKKSTVWRLPPVLTISFNRYDDRQNKIEKFIDFPINMVNFADLAERKNEKKMVYDLVAVANHDGCSRFGHYYSYGKNPDGKWKKYDDTRVTDLENESQVVTASAYFLVYVRRGLTIDVIFSK